VQLGAVHKGCPQSDLSSADILPTRGLFRCGHPHFLAQNSDFSKFIVYPHGQGGVEPLRTYSGQEGRSIFRDFVRTSFMDGPLGEAVPYYNIWQTKTKCWK